MKKRTKKIVISITASLLLFVYYNYDYKYVPQYEIVESVVSSTKPYARYRYGDVYIIKNINDLNSISGLSKNDVIILDQRKNENANMKIISSHLIEDKNARNDILEIIQAYEKENPSKWDRTIETMRVEWFVHNFLYSFNFKRDHTVDVDLDNNDEEIYKNSILHKILKI